ncbi:MAG: transporter substrate-binding domain-containing protein, partial [Clostridiales bacterium]
NQTADGAYVVLDDSLEAEEYGVGFRNEDIALGLKVQELMYEMVSDGTSAQFSNKWFGADILLTNTDLYEESAAPAGDTSLDDLMSRGKLVVGLDDSFPPMGFRSEEGDIVGFDIDLATEVCKRLGVELQLQPIDWDA